MGGLCPDRHLGFKPHSYSIRRRDRENAGVTPFIIALLIVSAILVGGLLALLRGRHVPLGSPEALERARQRNRALEVEERRENGD
jgi:hypothetical protein